MRCKNCEYALWNLRTHSCPECGTPFTPGEYEFTPNSVRFICPHCAQEYYGTDARGHLEPQSFDCVTCGRAVSMNEMLVLPAHGVEEVQTKLDRMPWLDRPAGKVVKPWFATLGRSMTSPQRLMRAVPSDASLSRAWLFMFISNFLFRLVGQIIPGTIILVVLVQIMNRAAGGSMPPFMTNFMQQQAMWQELTAIGALAVLPVLWILGTHGLLRISGGAPGGLKRTWHAICYSSGANALTAVPCGDCGSFGGMIWWMVSAILMVKEGHRIHGGRASFAVVTSGLVLAVIYLAATFLVSIIPMGGLAAMRSGRMSTVEITYLTDGIVTYHAKNGRLPRHACELVADGYATSWDFVMQQTNTFPDEIPVGNTTLEALESLPSGGQLAETARAAQLLPQGVVAHRAGDFVFTYHGMNLANADPGLWLVVMTPDPDQHNRLQPLEHVQYGQVDGSVYSIPYLEFQEELVDQNALRAQYNLSPLPDPQTVTHAQPATSAGP